MDAILNFLKSTGFSMIADDPRCLIMILISCVLLYLAIVKKFEPLLLLPIAFGMLLTNLPGAGIYHAALFEGGHVHWEMFASGVPLANGGTEAVGLIDILYLGVKLGVYPPLIFLGIGAMTDFSPLIANPKTIFLGAAAQLGIFVTFAASIALGFDALEASSIGIFGGADGPTAIFVTKTLAPHLLPAIAVAAYSYMALVPLIQPPIMRALTTKKERAVRMDSLRPVSKTEKILFPIIVTIVVAMLVPDATTLVGCLMLGNLLKESGVADRLVKTASYELINIITILLGVSVGGTATADNFLSTSTLLIIALGLCAFAIATAGGVLFGKLMYVLTKGKVNPLIGSAGVSAVPMAARVSNTVGLETDSTNYLLMHAMGPNVAGVIGSAVAAGVFISMFA